jgi:hypothetical protein
MKLFVHGTTQSVKITATNFQTSISFIYSMIHLKISTLNSEVKWQFFSTSEESLNG